MAVPNPSGVEQEAQFSYDPIAEKVFQRTESFEKNLTVFLNTQFSLSFRSVFIQNFYSTKGSNTYASHIIRSIRCAA